MSRLDPSASSPARPTHTTTSADDVLVCFALEGEARPLRKALGGRAGIRVAVVGMGSGNAERGIARLLKDARPRVVLTCGLAGGLRSELELGDIVYATSDADLARRLGALGARAAFFHCAERVVVSVAAKRALRDETGADAVEMESAPIHAACRARGIPCATVRVISDTSDQELPFDFNALLKPDMTLGLGKLVLALLRSPRRLLALAKLTRLSRQAAQRLAPVLLALLAPTRSGPTPAS